MSAYPPATVFGQADCLGTILHVGNVPDGLANIVVQIFVDVKRSAQ
jgi:hypothetical protein